MNISDLPNIKRAALAIAYDNGMICQFSTEADFLTAASGVLSADGVNYVDVQSLETWLGTLSPADQETMVVGEYSEMMEVGKSCPKVDHTPLHFLLDDIFNLPG